MKKAVGTPNHHRFTLVGRWVALSVILGWTVSLATAQDVRIRSRPLTPQEIVDYGLPADTQKTGGQPNVGIGQPVYLEALVEAGTTVTAVNWTIIGAPPSSTASLEPGPLDLTIPTYDGGDQIDLFVAGRAMLVPDKVSGWNFDIDAIEDYKVVTDVITDTGTISLTNSVFGGLYIGHGPAGAEPGTFLCELCHPKQWTNFVETDHASAFQNQISGMGSDHFNPGCISCHTVGYDTTPGAVNGGWDDVADNIGWTFPTTLVETNWTQMDIRLQHKSNILCENCHGQAFSHMSSLGQKEAIDISLSAGTCGQCHDALTHHVKSFEWSSSLHATGYVFRFGGSCTPCHSSKGFILTHDPAYSEEGDDIPRATEEEGIACATCHDPHSVGMGDYQLRDIPEAELENGVLITEEIAGNGVLCINCHHSRSDVAEAVAAPASSRFGPHHGPQGDMLMGTNGYEYDKEMPTSRHMAAVEDSCAGCHMQLVAGTDFAAGNTKVGGHTFRLIWDNDTPEDPTDDVHVTEVCSTCHVESGTFDFGGEDYDRDGLVEGVQSEIEGLMHTLGMLLPPVGSPDVVTGSSYDLQQKKAAWNYKFVEEDKSEGVHNPKYAAALLQAAIDDMTGGIDVDRDGLIDSWEWETFGSLTAQTGAGDYDGDGVSNAREVELGTNAKLADSDNDGFWDLAELQAGTDPNDDTDFPTENLVFQMLPALELGYMPGTMGVTQVFQSADMLMGGGWTNVGPMFVSEDAMAYQLISTKDSTQKVFRVVAP